MSEIEQLLFNADSTNYLNEEKFNQLMWGLGYFVGKSDGRKDMLKRLNKQ